MGLYSVLCNMSVSPNLEINKSFNSQMMPSSPKVEGQLLQDCCAKRNLLSSVRTCVRVCL